VKKRIRRGLGIRQKIFNMLVAMEHVPSRPRKGSSTMYAVKSAPGTPITLKFTFRVGLRLGAVVGLECDILGYVRRSVPEIRSSSSQARERQVKIKMDI
jgi:hypothetical protein